MDAFEVKVFLMKNGLSIADLAREMCKTSGATERSMHTMISDLIYGRRFYPQLAEKLHNKYGISIERPAQFEPARTIIQKAA